MESKALKNSIEKHTIPVMGIRFYCHTIEYLIEHIIEICSGGFEKENRRITATGAHGLSLSRRDRDFSEILNQSYLNLPDGMPPAWVGRLKGAPLMRRVPGPDFFEQVMRKTAQHPIKHFFLGGREGIADELKKSCAAKFNNSNVVGTICPPFRSYIDKEIVEYANIINFKETDILWIGISTPKQEFLAERLSGHLKTHFIIPVGAAFDFHSGNLKKAPKFIQEIGLEWAFRISKEPRRLFKRYITVVPEIIYYGIKDVLSHKKEVQ